MDRKLNRQGDDDDDEDDLAYMDGDDIEDGDASDAPATSAATGLPEGLRHLKSHGLTFPIDRRFIPRRQARALRNGNYEEREYRAVSSLAQPEDVVIELGAGIGFMSTVCAVLRKCREVHAYEANPELIPYIEEVHRLNGARAARITNAVLGAEDGTANFYVRTEFSSSSLAENPGENALPVMRVDKVPVLDIRRVFAEIRPSFFICDIEGAEADLIPLADLSTVRCAVVELHPQWIGKAGTQAVFDAFQSAGLTFYPLRSNKKVVTFRRDW